jgi:hypothetical protein
MYELLARVAILIQPQQRLLFAKNFLESVKNRQNYGPLVCGSFLQEFQKTIPTARLWEGFSPSFPQTGDNWNGYET